MDLSKTSPPVRRAALVAAAGFAAVAAAASSAAPALGAAAPGQPVVNDYGQSDVQVALEVKSAVDADPAVVAARAAAARAHLVVVARTTAYVKARNAYTFARAHHFSALRIARALAARNAAAKALTASQAVYNAAALKASRAAAASTARVRALHFRPLDGVWVGDQQTYFIPNATPPTEPLTVQVTVYGGHVSDVTVIKQAADSTESHRYNLMSLTTLNVEAVAADGSAAIAWVSGATLTSDAFQNSLQSALIKAGFHA